MRSTFSLVAGLLAILVGGIFGAEKPNILFIGVDDLRPELSVYGRPVVTPSVERLAAAGTVFERAYVQQALCHPSRVSLLTGRRPDTTGVVDFVVKMRQTLPKVVTLPQHFKANGYHTRAFGKIFHNDDPISWSQPLWKSGHSENEYHTQHGKDVLRWIKEDYRRVTYVWNLGDGVTKIKRPGGLPWEAADVADNVLREGMMTDEVIKDLRARKNDEKPWFLAVGYHKPHLPFIAPKKYFALYDREKIELASNPDPPKDAPPFALYNWNDLRHYYGVPDVGPMPDDQARDLRHAYYACVSYVDAQIGRLLDELEKNDQRKNTIICFWGDHGWQLGEHGMWDKHSNFETSTHAPLIVSVPGQKAGRTKALVEFVDLYPGLADLAGIPIPGGLEGTSFAPLIEKPDRLWKSAAFSQHPRVIPGYGQIARGMGYSMRTDRYRFTEWRVPGTGFREYELYDHQSDPDENINLAKQEDHADQIKQLSTQLSGGWEAALPPGIKAPQQTKSKKGKSPLHISRQTFQIEGWTVRVDQSLLTGGADPGLGRQAMDQIRADLTRLRVLANPKILKQLRKVTIVLDREHGKLKTMQYHPGADWLEDNGYERSLEKCVHIPRAAGYADRQHYFTQPSAMIHELAHAYHDQFLGFDEKRIKAAFARAQLKGQYEKVLFVRGGTRRHYALTNHKEYFAEATEAWFGTNDFYPFVRSELKQHDPDLGKVLKEIWGE